MRWTLLTAVMLGLGAACAVGACATQADTSAPPPDNTDSGPLDATPAKCVSANQTRCGINCTDLTKDPINCGTCGNYCGVNRFCSTGVCANSCLPPTTQCNNTSGVVCANLITDHDNCGKCATACMAAEDCVPAGTSAVCQKHCPAGDTLCGTDCTTLRNDPNHCGDCNTTCDTMSGQVCSDGLCCGPGQANCAGTCVSTGYDNNNCGSCGFACGGPTPYCVGSVCQTCNPAVLILSDGASSDVTTYATAITTAGATVTSGGKAQSFAGSPSATTFGSVVVIDYGYLNMPTSGQTDIATAVGNGTGLVVIDYELTYEHYYSSSTYATIYGLLPITTGVPNYAYTQHTLTKAVNHPIWNGITSPFTRTQFEDGTYATNNGGTVIATTYEGPSVVVKDPGGGKGKVVYINLWMSSSNWSTDPNMLKMMTNAATWATGCF